jgi:hypothetical protein
LADPVEKTLREVGAIHLGVDQVRTNVAAPHTALAVENYGERRAGDSSHADESENMADGYELVLDVSSGEPVPDFVQSLIPGRADDNNTDLSISGDAFK